MCISCIMHILSFILYCSNFKWIFWFFLHIALHILCIDFRIFSSYRSRALTAVGAGVLVVWATVGNLVGLCVNEWMDSFRHSKFSTTKQYKTYITFLSLLLKKSFTFFYCFYFDKLIGRKSKSIFHDSAIVQDGAMVDDPACERRTQSLYFWGIAAIAAICPI